MAVLTYNIDSTSALNFSSPALMQYLILTVVKRLTISSTSALISPSIVDPEDAYTTTE